MRHAALMFHAIRLDDRGVRRHHYSGEDAFYDVSVSQFHGCLGLIQEQNLRSLAVSEVSRPAASGDGVFITFDDGRQSDYSLALPALLERKMRAIFFIVSGWIGQSRFVSRANLREMADAGMDIQVHGGTHRFLTELPDRELRSELKGAKAGIEDAIGRPVRALSYPGGRGNRRVRQVARDVGYNVFFSSCPGWYRGYEAEVPRFVVHRNTSGSEVRSYLEGRTTSVLRPRTIFYLGRGLRRLVGAQRYARLKSQIGER